MCKTSDRISSKVSVEFSTSIGLSECELRALDALIGYGFDNFLKHFKENLGTHYIRDHEAGLKSFFGKVGSQLSALHTIDEARKLLKINDRSY